MPSDSGEYDETGQHRNMLTRQPSQHMNVLIGCSEYDEPQALENQPADSFQDEEFKRCHLASHDRPSLDDCTEEAFEADLCEFLRQRQEFSLAKAVSEHRITW